MKRKNIKIVLILCFLFSYSIYASEYLEQFKNTSIYKEGGYFKNAYITNKNVLILESTEKFNSISDKNKIIKEIATVLKKIIGSEEAPIIIGIKEDILKTTIYKIKKDNSIDKVEEINKISSVSEEKSIYFSMGLSGNLNGLSSAGILVGSYFLNNSFDIAGSINGTTGNLTLGFMARIHFLILPKLDLNTGAQLSLNVNNSDETTTSLSALLGISNFISYRSSLDFSLGINTTGIITLGTGITYYANMMPPILAEQPPEYKKPENRQVKEKDYNEKPIYTHTSTFTFTFTPTYIPTYTFTYTPTYTPEKFISPTETLIPTQQQKETQNINIEEPKATLKEEILQEIKQEKEEKKISEKIPEKIPESKKDTVAGFFVETNLYKYAKIFFDKQEDTNLEKTIDANFKLGFGIDNLFGMSFMTDISYLKYINLDFAYTFGLDIAFEFYPFLRSPSGLYISPVIGGMYYHGEKLGISIDTPVFSLGGAGGFRFLFDWFIFDIGVIYKANLVIKDEEYEIAVPFVHTVDTKDLTFIHDDELIFNIGIGFMFYAR